jgi:hypothetical protein
VDFWITFWSVIFVATLIVFAILAISVTIGGFFDLKRLLKSIDQQHARQETDQSKTSEDSLG